MHWQGPQTARQECNQDALAGCAYVAPRVHVECTQGGMAGCSFLFLLACRGRVHMGGSKDAEAGCTYGHQGRVGSAIKMQWQGAH
eukprot:scaffold259659_cov18-Tisochrysis_lutea.AAC.1